MESNKEMVFIDSSAFKALVDENDDFSVEAERLWEKLKKKNCSLLTSNFILDESFTLLRVRCGLRKALILREYLMRAEPKIKVARVTARDEVEAWEWFGKDWSKLSFTDCVSFVVMKRMEIKMVFSFDRHFARAGFKLVS